MREKRGAGLLVLLGALVLALGTISPAVAHADYRGSDPADGETVSSPPSDVKAEFTEPPASGSSLVVHDPCGERVDSGNYSYEGFPLNTMSVSMSATRAGEYRVQWTVVSAADSHTTRGVFTFVSSGGEKCPQAAGEPDADGENTAGGSSSSETEEAASKGDPGGEVAAADSGPNDKQGKPGKTRPKNGKSRSDRAGETATIDLAETEVAQERADKEDLPVDWLIVGLSISALIGAIAGRIYAGIRGPRR